MYSQNNKEDADQTFPQDRVQNYWFKPPNILTIERWEDGASEIWYWLWLIFEHFV